MELEHVASYSYGALSYSYGALSYCRLKQNKILKRQSQSQPINRFEDFENETEGRGIEADW